MPRVLVFGNEKGGTGKSTIAMHLTVNLLNMGYKVGTIDVDARQGTFSRYIENRAKKKEIIGDEVLMPSHTAIFCSQKNNTKEMEEENTDNFSKAIESYSTFDYIVIDTPGNDSNLSRIAHSYADKLITPMNESFIDLDLLVRLKESVAQSELRPSTYAEMVWDQKKSKAIRSKGTIDWVVLINRMSNIASRNRLELEKVLRALSKRIGFRLSKGFKERVIFRELFVNGLTILDKSVMENSTSLSHIAARRELADFMKDINI